MSPQTLLDPPEAPLWQPLLVVVSSLAALVLIMAVGLRLGEHPERAGETPAATVSTAVGEGTAPLMGGMAEYYREQAALAPPIAVAIVDALAQAPIVDDALDAATAILAASGEPTPTHHVTWFASAAAEAAFWWAMNKQQRARSGLGPVSVVDLRTAATGTRGTCGTSVTPAAW
jgi:hypothetical protein